MSLISWRWWTAQCMLTPDLLFVCHTQLTLLLNAKPFSFSWEKNNGRLCEGLEGAKNFFGGLNQMQCMAPPLTFGNLAFLRLLSGSQVAGWLPQGMIPYQDLVLVSARDRLGIQWRPYPDQPRWGEVYIAEPINNLHSCYNDLFCLWAY